MSIPTICSTCLLTSRTPGISFDENGSCNYCRDHRPMEVLGEEAFLKEIESHRGAGREFDCMIGVSGGRDSTFTLQRLAQDHGLRVLAVNYHNPFTSPEAERNLQEAVRRLPNVTLIRWSFPGDAHRKETRRAIRAWSRNPSSRLIPIVCTHCKSIWPTFFRIARDHGISLIVIGSNPLETASFKKAGLGGARDYHRLSKIPRILGISLGELIRNPSYLTHLSWGVVLKAYLMASHSSPFLRRMYPDVKVIRYFDYFRWDEREVLETITRELGWESSGEVASPWRFDCRLDFVRRKMYTATVGVSELRDLFSKMIREGMVTREEAFVRLEQEEIVPEEVAEDVLAGIGLTLKDLNLPLPPDP